MAGKPTLNGRELSEFELAQLRRQIESFGSADIVTDELRGLIESQWPDLLANLPPRKPS